MLKGSKPVCICVGHYRPATGLSRVLETITRSLSDDYEFHYIGIGYKGPVIDDDITIYPCNLEGGDVFGVYQLQQRIEALQPALVFLLNDIWMLANYGQVCEQASPPVPFVAYAAIDGKIVNEEAMGALSYLSALITYTDFARNEVNSQFLKVNQNTPALYAIPHGVDTDTFRPLCNRIELKRKIFPHLQNIEDSFIVLNANRPHERKRIDHTIDAFAAFSRGKPQNVMLYLHHAVTFDYERSQIQGWIKDAGIEDRTILTPLNMEFIDDEKMNEIYNACDVGINTSMGEGWGMVSMEHAAAGMPQLVPGHSACAEIWHKIDCCIETTKSYVPKFSLLQLTEISVNDATQKLDRLYRDENYRISMTERCYALATDSQYQWKKIAGQWHQLFF